jgi:hypothetical protein
MPWLIVDDMIDDVLMDDVLLGTLAYHEEKALHLMI